MQPASVPIVKDLVLVGGGHSHAIVLRLFGMKPLPGVRLTLITDVIYAPYSGMLPGYIAGFYEYDECHIDLRKLAQFAGAQLLIDRAIQLDLDKNYVICGNHPPVKFDVLSIDIGSTPNTLTVPGASEFAIPVKPIDRFLVHWHQAIAERQKDPDRKWQIAIVGGGVSGVELALNMRTRLSLTEGQATDPSLQIHLCHRQAELMTEHNPWVRRRLTQILRAYGIHLHLNETVSAITQTPSHPLGNPSSTLQCESGFTLECDRIFWVTQASAPPWLKASGLATDERGFIQVNSYLQSISHPQIFAAGDIASQIEHPHPKAGVFAVRQGKPLFQNLRNFLLQKPPVPYIPQKQYLSLIGTGDRRAIASRGPFVLGASPWLWRWKDGIDRQFMAKFEYFPSMETPKRVNRSGEALTLAPQDEARELALKKPQLPAMHCAGCGSKVGSPILERVLHRLKPDLNFTQRSDIVIGLNSPDDCAAVQVPSGQLMVHTLDYFRALVNDPFIFGQIVANHALSDIFAMGATPQTALAIATIPYGGSAQVEETLYQLLAGVLKVLNQSETALVGGHTAEGSELAFGLSCNGLANPDRLLRKGGMAANSTLILTKPLGTGTLFAAEMRLQAKGRWINSAIESMLLSNQAAARCFLQHQASACTDITGFGLMGHLSEMIQSFNLARDPVNSDADPIATDSLATVRQFVDLYIDTIPALDGSIETLNQGIISSLHPQNLQFSQHISNLSEVIQHPKYPLLFDPQTAGGLLAAVPEEQANACLASLQACGYKESRIIGRVKLGNRVNRAVNVVMG